MTSNKYLLNKKTFLKKWNNNVCSSDFDSNISGFSVGGYVNFVLERPCPEKYYGSPKCYTYTYRTNNSSNQNLKRVYVKKPWENFDDVLEEKDNG